MHHILISRGDGIFGSKKEKKRKRKNKEKTKQNKIKENKQTETKESKTTLPTGETEKKINLTLDIWWRNGTF